jgi:UDPglucose--hexose-1-phosphate uridylyltransferase
VSELRWHPFLGEWVGVAAARQNRPQLPKDWCPFCPGSGHVPDHYDVLLYPNDFAAFNQQSGPFSPETGPYKETGAKGYCDVVIYHPDHTLLPSQLHADHWRKIIDLWASRTEELQKDPDVVQVFIFENTGEAIGVTMPHPHGQIYSFPFVPPLLQREYDNARAHHQRTGECLYCFVLSVERDARQRWVAENDHFFAFVPYWQRFPAEIQIYSKRHVESLCDLSGVEKNSLSEIIRTVRLKYDNLYGFQLPLMMIVRQRPAKGDYAFFHLHIELLPLQRSATKLKYLAGVETGSGTFLNDTVADQRAADLRDSEPATTASV